MVKVRRPLRNTGTPAARSTPRAVGIPPKLFVAVFASAAGTARASAPGTGTGPLPGPLIGLAATQLCGTDNFPTGAALPTLASAGRRMTPNPSGLGAIPAGGTPVAPDWTLLRKTPVPPLITDVAVRLKAAPKVADPVRVLKLLNAVSTDDELEDDELEDTDAAEELAEEAFVDAPDTRVA